ncbi:MAG: tRNA (adenosine(37)-N6)-dimethylallyltransferase MiaA [Lachnospiraceae bacterium]|nr:tRNA (adenosine(37)-N6)-dimethylallyltransferase MiaA [Lachnospiraceae bacterium]
MDDKKKRIVILAGPTAVGKSETSLILAEHINGQIVSADSMQVYRHMDIGSAKLPADMRRGITHHMIDVLEPDEDFNVSVFKNMAKSCIDKIHAEGSIPIVCGGTGFYIRALIYDIDFSEGEVDTEVRKYFENLAEDKGIAYMEELLRKEDPKYADLSHGNLKRIIRALEYNKLTGEKMSDKNEAERAKEPAYDAVYYVLYMPREKLYARIEKRVDQMMDDGFLSEVKALKEMGVSRDMTSMQGLGYRQLYDHLDGKYDLDTAIDEIKKQTRHFAKRQITWFKREKEVTWIDVTEFNKAGEIAEWINTDITKRWE